MAVVATLLSTSARRSKGSPDFRSRGTSRPATSTSGKAGLRKGTVRTSTPAGGEAGGGFAAGITGVVAVAQEDDPPRASGGQDPGGELQRASDVRAGAVGVGRGGPVFGERVALGGGLARR